MQELQLKNNPVEDADSTTKQIKQLISNASASSDIISTRIFQLLSLDRFMEILGYIRISYNNPGYADTWHNWPRSQRPAYISFEDAVLLYNSEAKDAAISFRLSFEVKYPCLKGLLKIALDHRTFDEVYLQRTKRDLLSFKVTKDLIKFHPFNPQEG